jgi:spore coat protein A
MLSRRKLLTLGGLAGGVVLIPTGMLRAGASRPPTAATHSLAHRGARPVAQTAQPPIEPFSVRMPVPPVLVPTGTQSGVDCYELPIRPANVEIFPGLRTPALTYGGRFVGPTIRARSGRPVVVKYRNELGEPANVHLHGGHVPAASDGHPMDVIEPGRTRQYSYPNRQPGATLWYHDHVHHLEAEHVFRGLHGFYLLEGEDEAGLGLPGGQYDVPIMLRNAKFDENGAILYSPLDDPSTRTTYLANGRPTPYFPVAARKYRFRLLNASNHGDFLLSIDGVQMIQIASDGGLLPRPVPRTELLISPAERAEVVIDFGGRPIGSQLVLNDQWGPVLRFDVVRDAADNSRVPDVLRPLPSLPPATKVRDMTLGLSDDEQMFWIDGKPFDPNRVDAQIKRGSTEIWRVTNLDGEFGIDHNLHLHLVQFRVLDRDGAPPPPEEAGLKDTVRIPPGSTVRLQATFADYLGRFTYHCHMMEHSSAFGMMAQMEIVR